MHSSLLHQIALTMIPMVGAVTAKNLIGYCGGVEAIFSASEKDLLAVPGVGEETAKSILKQDVLAAAETEAKFIEKQGIQTYFYLDKNYPNRLKRYTDAPVMLYYKGTAPLNFHRMVAMVGTRKPSPQGVLFCEELVDQLKVYQPLIISGLAFGIDITAHRAALAAGLPTIGVMGNGFRKIYPHEHSKTAYEMMEQGGILTEFPSHVHPDGKNFPMRNRIVAAMCDAIVVVETKKKGGSMITANLANSYHKDVFAIPGRPKDPMSVGCNNLIKSHRANLLESADDIAYVMRWEPTDRLSKTVAADQGKLFIDLTENEQRIIDLIQSEEDIDLDTLVFKSKLNGSQMAALILGLEFKGIVKTLPGKRFILT